MRIPKYRKHTSRDLAFSEFRGKRTYFTGKFKSPESLQAYSEFIRTISDAGQKSSPPPGKILVSELVAAFLDWARTRYVKNGRSTGTYEKARLIVQPLLALHEQTPVAEFGPLALKKVREKMLESGLCRNEINDRVSRIKRIFSWGVENEMVSPETAGALKYVTGLRKGETTARETDPVTAVADCDIEAILPLLPPTLDDLVTLHRLIGGRPSEACNLRWCDIDQSDAIWIYVPWEHKTEHKNKQRRIAIPKLAQKILEKYRHRPETEFIFSPRETVRLLAERRRKNRKSKPTPSQNERSRKAALRAKKDGPKHADRYTCQSYERAVRRACLRAKIEPWSPNQLRHSFATEARRVLGAEAAQLLLGHANLSTTEIYAEKELASLKLAAEQIERKKGV